jgi:cell division cycle 2-like protein
VLSATLGIPSAPPLSLTVSRDKRNPSTRHSQRISQPDPSSSRTDRTCLTPSPSLRSRASPVCSPTSTPLSVRVQLHSPQSHRGAKCNDTGGIYALKKLKLEEEKHGFPITSLREVMALMAAGAHENVVGIREIVVGDTLNQ